ncbi:hypothetical protein ASD15_08595 [Massilia sp. Root351]|nr:hypothetical protein ASD15_08595 [Massilia sp. Root351]
MRRQSAKIAPGTHDLNIDADWRNTTNGTANPAATMRQTEIWRLSQTGYVHDRRMTMPLDHRNGVRMNTCIPKGAAQQHAASQKLRSAHLPFETVKTVEFALSQLCKPGSDERRVQVGAIQQPH